MVMSLLLGFVYAVTEEPIALAKLADKRAKLAEVMPAFANDPAGTVRALDEEGQVELHTGQDAAGAVTGYGITSEVTSGYSGAFSIVFGVTPEGVVRQVRLLESKETPGLGSKAGLPDWLAQFEGQALGTFDFRVTKDGGQVDAVTGATITSRAVCDALRQGLEAFGGEQLEVEPDE